jgi:hypothetical protein
VWTLSGNVNVGPGTYILRMNVADDDGASANGDITLTVLQEDARITYAGPMLVSTPSISNSVATIELRAIIQDITAVLPALDPNGGIITNATVTFINRETGAVIAANLPVGLFQSNDSLTGIATFSWVVDIGNADSVSYEVGIIVGGFYTRNHTDDDVLITVTRPLDNMVTGGGYLINDDSAGVYAGDDGRKTNFGFNVKFNKQLTALQGHVNIIIRQNGHNYQIKTNAMQSLAVNPVAHTATFISKANLQDVTDPSNPISLGGNLSLIITLTDPGEPGTSDTIGITLWKGTQLLYSSHWSGTQTIEQLLDGGNIVIHTNGQRLGADPSSSTAPSPTSFDPLTEEALLAVAQKAITAWSDAAISNKQAHMLSHTKFVVADLDGPTLGLSLGDTIWIDADGAGLGWSNAFDLLTVVTHELGHRLGLDHSDANDVMHETLQPGVRVLPTNSWIAPASMKAPVMSFSGPENTAFKAPQEFIAILAEPSNRTSRMRTRKESMVLKRSTHDRFSHGFPPQLEARLRPRSSDRAALGSSPDRA